MDIKACTSRLNIIRHGNLDDSMRKVEILNTSFNCDLKDHQKTIVYAMQNLEDNRCDGDDNYSVHTSIGVVGDATGSGKSVDILALINETPVFTPKQRVIQQFGSFLYVKTKAKDDFVHSNLIVIPHSCLTQWQEYVSVFTNLTFQTISKRKEIDLFQVENIKQIVICTNSMYNNFLSTHRLTWSRVVFDEADTINIPAAYSPSSNFVWFLSSSLQNLLFPSGTYFEHCKLPHSERTMITRKYTEGIRRVGYIRETFRTLERYDADYVISKIILKNNDDYVKKSFELPEPQKHIILCRTPSYLQMLIGVVNNDIIKLLNAGNINGAIEKIGCPIESHENIVDSVTKTLHTKLNNLTRELTYVKSLEHTRDTDIENSKKKIESIEEQTKGIQHKIDCITSRLRSYTNDICGICMDSHDNPTVVKCCQKVYCFACITRCVNVKSSCPHCRECIHPDSMVVIGEKKVTKKILLDKHEALINLLNVNSTRKFLIFSSHDQSFSYIESALQNVNQKFVKLMGSIGRINSILKQYREGDLNVLMLNTSHYGTGLNLENTTDLVFYHKMSADMEKQVIGRAQRVGRKAPLQIHYLYQENEVENI